MNHFSEIIGVVAFAGLAFAQLPVRPLPIRKSLGLRGLAGIIAP